MQKKKIAKEVRLCRISGETALDVGMMGFGINFVLGILFNFLPEEWLESYEATASAAFSGELWLAAITVAVMAPIVEEFLFRGLIYTRLKQGMPMVAAVGTYWFLKIPKAEISAETAGETAVYEPEETGDVSEKVTQESGEDSTENP